MNNKNFINISKNFFYLTIVNIANFVLPFLTFPYLVNTIGVEKFGLLAFATSIITYFSIFTDYGFNLTATKLISINREDNNKLNEIFSSVIILKSFLMIISFITLLILILYIDKFNTHYYIYLYSFGVIIGQVLYPTWFFQGIEKMKLISILNVALKLFFTLGVFKIVKEEKDFFIVPILSAIGNIIVGITSLIFVFAKYNIKFKFQNLGTLRFYIKDGWFIFISNVSVTLYTTATITILGFFTNNQIVGYYSIADKIISAIRGLMNPFSQVLFPFLSKKSINNPKEVLIINKKLLIILGPIFLLISILIFSFSDGLIFILFNKTNIESSNVLKILSIIPTILIFHIIYALFTMIIFNLNKEYSRIIISAAMINIFTSTILIYKFQHIGAAINIVIIEMYLLVRYILSSKKNKLKIL